MVRLVIDGRRIHDITSLYDEINKEFMAGEDWKLAPSLDALNDLLHGGFGAIKGNEPVELVWQGFEKNRVDLGFEATQHFYLEKLQHPKIYDQARIKQDLLALESGTGPTYFDIVLEIIADHPNIMLLPQ